ncbi:MAG: hypothetical protein LBD14_05150 [Puniceicoccales bacterium]|jgi:Trk-type K+ transport system membrane component|nr:hypothetical protein [Puniceicoccales bacterium]
MFERLSERTRGWVFRLLNGVLGVCGLGALGAFLWVLCWPVEVEVLPRLRLATHIVLGIFVAQEALRVVLQPRPLGYVSSHKVESLLAVVAGMEIFFHKGVHNWFEEHLGLGVSFGTFTLFYLVFSQLTLGGLVMLRVLRNNRLLSYRWVSPGVVFMLSFAVLVGIGTLLLKAPLATVKGIGWVDALFTATSAVCVTGLSVVDTPEVFTRHGQWVLLGLIQLGGLGVMTWTYFFAYFLAGGVSLRNRMGLQDLLSENTLGRIGSALGAIVGFTFTCEFVGGVAFYVLLGQEGGVGSVSNGDRFFFSAFHAVSSFCSAGFSTLRNGFADNAVRGCHGILFVVMALVLLGSMGFPVLKNCSQVLVASLRRRAGLWRGGVRPRLNTNTLLVLVTTGVLLVLGTGGIYVSEFLFGGASTTGGMTEAWFVSAFNATTARTAGFAVTTGVLFAPATAIIVMFLMFVGGGPSSTAGGIKTTTLAVAVLALRRVVLGRADIEAFGRRLDDAVAHRALATILVSIAFLMTVSVLLCMLHPELPALDLGFEAVSAISTAGLSRGVTPRLGDSARCVLVFAMFFGRVGVLTCLMAFVRRRDATGYRFPEGTVVIN